MIKGEGGLSGVGGEVMSWKGLESQVGWGRVIEEAVGGVMAGGGLSR